MTSDWDVATPCSVQTRPRHALPPSRRMRAGSPPQPSRRDGGRVRSCCTKRYTLLPLYKALKTFLTLHTAFKIFETLLTLPEALRTLLTPSLRMRAPTQLGPLLSRAGTAASAAERTEPSTLSRGVRFLCPWGAIQQVFWIRAGFPGGVLAEVLCDVLQSNLII